MRCRTIHFALALIVASCCMSAGCQQAKIEVAPPEPTPSSALQRGIDWLVKQQAADGGWHSSTYGGMRDGAGNTALVLYALAHVRDLREGEHRAAFDSGLKFLVQQLEPSGAVRAGDQPADYPNYATSLTLTAMHRAGITDWPDERQRMVRYLQQAQLTVARGYSADFIELGGWNHAGGGPASEIRDGETNISVTSFALEALAVHDALSPESRAAALGYLTRCQNLGPGTTNDGGFYFTPIKDDPRNKEGQTTLADGRRVPQSYRSTTADGWCGLLACGLSRDAPRYAAAIQWLESNGPVHEIFIHSEQDELVVKQRESMWFYYHTVLPRLGMRNAAAMESLLKRQHADGSWRNASALMREDDPLIATSFAIIILAGSKD